MSQRSRRRIEDGREGGRTRTLTTESPKAMWKFPATLFTDMKPFRLQPSPFRMGPTGAGTWKPGWHCGAVLLEEEGRERGREG